MMNCKKVLASLLAIVMGVQMIGIEAVAESEETIQQQNSCQGDPGYGISNIPLEEQLADFLANPDLTNEQKEAAKVKIEQAISLRDGNGIQTRATFSNVYLSVPAYTQEQDYYCGPATVRQVLGWFGTYVPGTYTPPSQTTIANAIGTTTSAGTQWDRMVEYINSYTFVGISPSYIEFVPTSVLNMEMAVYTSLTQTNPSPPILHVDTNGNSSILGYSTDRHYMNASGIKTVNGVNYFELTDPNRGREGLTPKYEVTTENIYNITRNHWAQHMLY